MILIGNISKVGLQSFIKLSGGITHSTRTFSTSWTHCWYSRLFPYHDVKAECRGWLNRIHFVIITWDQVQPRVSSAKTRTTAEKDLKAGLNMEGKKNETASCGRDLNCVINIESSLQSITQQGLVKSIRQINVYLCWWLFIKILGFVGLNLGYFSHTKLNHVLQTYTPQI